MSWYEDPNFLKSQLDASLNDVKESGYIYAKKLENLQNLDKEKQDLDLKIHEITQNIRNARSFVSNHEYLIQNAENELEKLKTENQNLEQELLNAILENCSYSLDENDKKYKLIEGIVGQTQLVQGSILKSLLIAQKAKLFKLYDEHRKLTQNIFCLVDEDPEEYKISDNLHFPDFMKGTISEQFANVAASIPTAYHSASEFATHEITQIDIPTFPSTYNGVEFEVLRKFSSENTTTEPIEKYIQQVGKISNEGYDKVINILSEIEKMPVPEHKYDENVQNTRTWLKDPVNAINKAQNAINCFQSCISMGKLVPQSSWEIENTMREQMEVLVDQINIAHKNFSNFLKKNKILPIPNITEHKSTSVGTIPQAQVEKTFDLTSEAEDFLSEVSAEQSSLVEHVSSAVNVLRDEYVRSKSSANASVPSDLDFNELIMMQDEIAKKQDSELAAIASILEIIPSSLGAFNEFKASKVDTNLEAPKNLPKFVTKSGINDDLLATVRSKKYLYYRHQDEDQPTERTLEFENPAKEIIDKWRHANFDAAAAKDPVSISAEWSSLREAVKQKEEYLTSQRSINASNEMKNKVNVTKLEENQKTIEELQQWIKRYENGINKAGRLSGEYREKIATHSSQLKAKKAAIERKERISKSIEDIKDKTSKINEYIDAEKLKIKQSM